MDVPISHLADVPGVSMFIGERFGFVDPVMLSKKFEPIKNLPQRELKQLAARIFDMVAALQLFASAGLAKAGKTLLGGTEGSLYGRF